MGVFSLWSLSLEKESVAWAYKLLRMSQGGVVQKKHIPALSNVVLATERKLPQPEEGVLLKVTQVNSKWIQ